MGEINVGGDAGKCEISRAEDEIERRTVSINSGYQLERSRWKKREVISNDIK